MIWARSSETIILDNYSDFLLSNDGNIYLPKETDTCTPCFRGPHVTANWGDCNEG